LHAKVWGSAFDVGDGAAISGRDQAISVDRISNFVNLFIYLFLFIYFIIHETNSSQYTQ